MDRVQVSIPADMLAALDEYREEYGYSRSQAVRMLLKDGLSLALALGREGA